MYNVPFHLTNFDTQTTQQTSAATNNSNNDDKNNRTTLNSPTAPSEVLQQQPDSGYHPVHLTSPTPSHKAVSTHKSNQRMYDTTFEQQQHSPNNDNGYYATNDDWVTSPHPTTKTDNNQDDTYGTSPNSGTLEDELQQQHMQQLFEKKRRRRESHNAVERRRRDNINERIFELSTLLPERDAIKNNKGTILRKSVEHIRVLHEQVNKCQHRIQELENLLGMYRIRGGGGDLALDLQQQQRSIPPMMQSTNMNYSASITPQLAYRRDG